jgi:hypothetical protein
MEDVSSVLLGPNQRMKPPEFAFSLVNYLAPRRFLADVSLLDCCDYIS